MGRYNPRARPVTSGNEDLDDSQVTHNPQSSGFKLVTEKSLNLTKLHGEQGPQNKVSYTKWAWQLKDFIESKGVEGQALVKAGVGHYLRAVRNSQRRGCA